MGRGRCPASRAWRAWPACFAARLRRRRDAPGPGAWTLAVARVGLGLALPMTVVLTAGPYGLPLAVAAGLVGELLDRASFYDSLEVTTPRGRMASDLAERGSDLESMALE